LSPPHSQSLASVLNLSRILLFLSYSLLQPAASFAYTPPFTPLFLSGSGRPPSPRRGCGIMREERRMGEERAVDVAVACFN
ncbi:hypothetical protein KUCAC02_018198, partial [Chaenocephalus aceratus]